MLDLIKNIVVLLQELLHAMYPDPETNPKDLPMNQPPLPPNNLLNVMCLAIQKHEGWILNPPSRSVRNKNPGNLRFANQIRAIGEDAQKFAIFANYQDGFNALKGMILNAAKGRSGIYHSTDNLYDFFTKFAPASDNNLPLHYAEVVANAMQVNPAAFRLTGLL